MRTFDSETPSSTDRVQTHPTTPTPTQHTHGPQRAAPKPKPQIPNPEMGKPVNNAPEDLLGLPGHLHLLLGVPVPLELVDVWDHVEGQGVREYRVLCRELWGICGSVSGRWDETLPPRLNAGRGRPYTVNQSHQIIDQPTY